ncbi:MAG TPA: hypothetical protein VI818_00080 [Candidatus Thermoplasmatota archaeon]|nr:hypothetical protein [Candidatus Thermoplasmatota archaeon]
MGLTVGASTLFGLGVLVEGVLWALAGAACVFLVYWRRPHRTFLHGFLASSIAGLLATLLQLAFLDAFLAGHPRLSEGQAGFFLPAGWFVFGTNLVGTGVTAAAVGALAAYASPTKTVDDSG